MATTRGKLLVNKDLIGQDAAVLAEHAGVKVPADTELLFGETDESHPFVDHEQMMPFVPFVRVPDVDTAIALAKKYEHGFKHTASSTRATWTRSRAWAGRWTRRCSCRTGRARPASAAAARAI